MDLNLRLVWLDDAKAYLSIAAHGDMQSGDFKDIFRSVGEALTSLDGAALVDLRQACWDSAATDSNAVVLAFLAFMENRLRMDNKIAPVCGRDLDQLQSGLQSARVLRFGPRARMAGAKAALLLGSVN